MLNSTTGLKAIATSGLLIGLGAVTVPAQSASLTGEMTGTWSDAVGGSNISYPTLATGENQVRWGSGFPTPAIEPNSGLGFMGNTAIAADFGETFWLGSLVHYNNPIFSGGSPSSVTLNLAVNLFEIGSSAISLNLLVDETPNQSGTCAYASTSPCADAIILNDSFTSQVFQVGATDYTLEFLGFADEIGGTPLERFISQEGESTVANLYGRVAAVTDPPEVPAPGSPEAVPEPLTILGTLVAGGTMGLMKLKSRRAE